MPLVLPGQEVSLSEPGRRFERHHHLQAYVALLISGECHEAGDCGRFHAFPGSVLIHDRFDGHADRIGHRGAVFANIRLKRPPHCRFGRIEDVDAVIRAFERDEVEGEGVFHSQFRPEERQLADWPDLLAADLVDLRAIRLDKWAEAQGLHPSSVSRGFRLSYGVSPKRYRFEQMAANAARRLTDSTDNIATIAADCGFADQSHMTRALVGIFGETPKRLRRLS